MDLSQLHPDEHRTSIALRCADVLLVICARKPGPVDRRLGSEDSPPPQLHLGRSARAWATSFDRYLTVAMNFYKSRHTGFDDVRAPERSLSSFGFRTMI